MRTAKLALVTLITACASLPTGDLPTDAAPIGSNFAVTQLTGEWSGKFVTTPTGRCPISNAARPMFMTIMATADRHFAAQYRATNHKCIGSIEGAVRADFTIAAVENAQASCGTGLVPDIRQFNGRFLQTSQGLFMVIEADLTACRDMGCTFHERGVFQKTSSSQNK